MVFKAIVEVCGEQSPAEQETLIAWAYRFSRNGRVMLVLQNVTRATADRILDRVVRREGLDVEGILYMDAREQGAAAALAATASVVVATSAAFRELLANRGVTAYTPADLRPVQAGVAEARPPRSLRRTTAAIS